MRTRLVPLIAPLLLRLAPSASFLFRTVSQTGIEYRQSSLSEGAAGAVQGGDRLPWVVTGPNEDNFAPLESIDWQVHMYGEPVRGVTDACSMLGLPIHVFAWTPETERAGLERGALYLVRPDGYVALADPDADPERLRRYSTSRGFATVRDHVESKR